MYGANSHLVVSSFGLGNILFPYRHTEACNVCTLGWKKDNSFYVGLLLNMVKLGLNVQTYKWISGYHLWVSGSASLINMFVSCVLLLPSSYPPSGIIKHSSNTLNLIYLSAQAVLIMFSCFCNCLLWNAPGDKINWLKGNITLLKPKQMEWMLPVLLRRTQTHGSTSQIALSGGA